MKTILVPTEQSPTMVSALDTALLLARKFDSCIEGFPLRPAVADLVAMDPDSGLTMVAVKENDAEMVRQAEALFRSFMQSNQIAESTGKTVNFTYPHAWRYRYYVISSFNADKPFDEFLKEQLAGDLMNSRDANDRAENLIATGYLAVGTKGHNTRGKAPATGSTRPRWYSVRPGFLRIASTLVARNSGGGAAQLALQPIIFTR